MITNKSTVFSNSKIATSEECNIILTMLFGGCRNLGLSIIKSLPSCKFVNNHYYTASMSDLFDHLKKHYNDKMTKHNINSPEELFRAAFSYYDRNSQ